MHPFSRRAKVKIQNRLAGPALWLPLRYTPGALREPIREALRM